MALFLLHIYDIIISMKDKLLLIILLSISILSFAEDSQLNLPIQKIKSAFIQNQYTSLESFLPKDRKIYFFIPQLNDKNGYFTSQQLHFILKNMEEVLKTKDFVFQENNSKNSNSNYSTLKAKWDVFKNDTLFSINLFFYLEKIDDQWKILEIKIS
jgi:hypothetical protein